MSEPAELKNAKRDKLGNVAFAHLLRDDGKTWDFLAVGNDNQPLVFRGADNRTMVLVSTPPGTRPWGTAAMPADASGSPIGTMVGIVTREGYAVYPTPSGDQPPVELGRNMADFLIHNFATHKGNSFQIAKTQAADGGTANVLLDWDGRPIMFWFQMPESGRRELMIIVDVTDVGFIVSEVDQGLRPLLSDAELARRFKKDNS